MLKSKIFMTVSLSLFVSISAMASGGYYSGDSSYSSGSNKSYSSSKDKSTKKAADTRYEYGKSVFNGRSAGSAREFCILQGDNSVKVDANSIKKLKNATYEMVGKSLHDCADPSQSIAQLLDSYQVDSVAYYLNKRYQLGLTAS